MHCHFVMHCIFVDQRLMKTRFVFGIRNSLEYKGTGEFSK